MATAARKSPRAPSSKTNVAVATKDFSWTDPFLAIYRFLASVKLAVISLGSLAFVLAFATFYERDHGSAAVNETIYQSVPFAVLLAFLGINILCAALIRYPWKKRQIGFLITHVGLITLLIGSAITLRYAEEGTFTMVEDKSKIVDVVMIKRDADVVRVEPFDPHSGAKEGLAFSFRHGAYAWEPGRTETLSDKDSPYKVVIRDYLPSAQLRYFHEADKNGVPMIKFGLEVVPPGLIHSMDPFQFDTADRLAWFKAGGPFKRGEKDSAGGVRLAFQYVEKADEQLLLADFLNPPKGVASSVVRIRFQDKAGKDRVLDWPLDPVSLATKPLTLPESDWTIVAAEEKLLPNQTPGEAEPEDDSPLSVVVLSVRKADGETREHWGVTSPKIATFVPPKTDGGAPMPPWVELSYFHVPNFGGMVRGLVEVVGTSTGELYARSINRSGIKPLGKIEIGKQVVAFGGNGTGSAMSLAFRVEDYLPSARERFSYVPRELPVGMKDQAVAAARVDLTIDGETREIWLLKRDGEVKPDYRTVQFPRGLYRVAFDADRKPLGFKLKLVNFESFTEPGTDEPTKFESDVLVTDDEQHIKDKPYKIEMNYPLDHRGYKFYQSSYQKLLDDDDRPTGQFASVFQVGHDPGRTIKYLGSILIVLGTFVQFYMRAGVATLFMKPKKPSGEVAGASEDSNGATRVRSTPSESRSPSTIATDPDDL